MSQTEAQVLWFGIGFTISKVIRSVWINIKSDFFFFFFHLDIIGDRLGIYQPLRWMLSTVFFCPLFHLFVLHVWYIENHYYYYFLLLFCFSRKRKKKWITSDENIWANTRKIGFRVDWIFGWQPRREENEKVKKHQKKNNIEKYRYGNRKQI